MSIGDLERHLYDYLKGKAYLVVVDDVWEKEAWQSLKRAFSENENGSRVIITTRKKDVALRSDERTHAHELRNLTENESWQLFSQKAFRNSHIDEGLENVGREMVQKCGGLPLALVVLGGFLSTKNLQESHVVRDQMWRCLRDDSLEISYLLALSFNDLSYQLKMCFLYLGLYPEDYVISVDELIRLFVAEGFIAPQNNVQVMEDVARDAVEELIDRSFIQIEKSSFGKSQKCRVHDLLRDLAIQKAKELNIFHIYDEIIEPSASSSSSVASCRRQAIFSFSRECSSIQHVNPFSRSIFYFNKGAAYYSESDVFFTTLFRTLKLLRVLNLRFAAVGLPEEIGELIHLKYLGLSFGYVRDLPKSILNLRSLQTLEARREYDSDWSYLELPTDIHKLQELRHLVGSFRGHFVIDNMTNLQTLKVISYDSWSKANTEKLVNLRELHIECYATPTVSKNFTFDSVANLKRLRILSVTVLSSWSFASLEPLSLPKSRPIETKWGDRETPRKYV